MLCKFFPLVVSSKVLYVLKYTETRQLLCQLHIKSVDGSLMFRQIDKKYNVVCVCVCVCVLWTHFELWTTLFCVLYMTHVYKDFWTRSQKTWKDTSVFGRLCRQPFTTWANVHVRYLWMLSNDICKPILKCTVRSKCALIIKIICVHYEETTFRICVDAIENRDFTK